MLRSDTLDFFLNPKPSICSLEVICEMLKCGPTGFRSRVREVLHLGGGNRYARPPAISQRRNGERDTLSCLDARRVVDAAGRSLWDESREHQKGSNQGRRSNAL